MSYTQPIAKTVTALGILASTCTPVMSVASETARNVRRPSFRAGKCVPFQQGKEKIKKSIIASIASYPEDVELFVVNSFALGDLLGEKPPHLRFPYYVLDISPARLLFASLPCGMDGWPKEGGRGVFFRHSDRFAKNMFGVRCMDRMPEPRTYLYIGDCRVDDGMCRLVFATRNENPIDANYRPIRIGTKTEDGTVRFDEPKFDEFLSRIGCSKASVNAASNSVFKICDGGVFGLTPESVSDVVRHDSPQSANEHRETTPAVCDIVQLTKREVSEVAFWVFAKRNRKPVYSRLAERHPELFLPMSGFADFETEIGNGLAGWTPPVERPPRPRRAPPSPPPPPPEVRRLLPYDGGEAISADLRRYGLKAGVFVRSGARGSNEVPFLVYGPKRGANGGGPLPLLVYFGGLGEMGGDLARQFHQRTVFEQVTSEEFQSRRPCYLFAPVFPSGLCDVAPLPGVPSESNRLTMEALRLVLARLGDAVDTNRLYTTGLSSGGCMAFDMLTSYPGVFAASVPVGGFERHGMITNRVVAWKIENARRERDDDYYWSLAAVARRKGGELRCSAYPSPGHNAWDRAWSDPRVWDWLFAQSLDGRPVRGLPPPARDLSWARCTSSRPDGDGGHPPRCGADGLSGTWFEMKDAVRGDWWAAEFESPLAGRFEVETGRPDGVGAVRKGRVETSEDGRRWTVAATLSGKAGAASFAARRPVRAVRVVVTGPGPAPFAVRNLAVR